jgi:hypothetical protein
VFEELAGFGETFAFEDEGGLAFHHKQDLWSLRLVQDMQGVFRFL